MQTLAANSNNYAVSCHDQGNKYFNRNPQKRNRATIETWARKPKHLPHVVGLAQNHSSFGVTRCADFTKSRFATRALQAIYMPVLIESMKQEAIHDFFSASSTRFHPSLILSACWMNEKQRSVRGDTSACINSNISSLFFAAAGFKETKCARLNTLRSSEAFSQQK